LGAGEYRRITVTNLDTRHPESTAICGYGRLQVEEYIERLRQIRAQGRGLDERKAAIVVELRRLYNARPSAFAIVDSPRDEDAVIRRPRRARRPAPPA
jgi:hypothetical protein